MTETMLQTGLMILLTAFLVAHGATAIIAGWRARRPPPPAGASPVTPLLPSALGARGSVGVLVPVSGLPASDAKIALSALRLLPRADRIVFCAFDRAEPIVPAIEAGLAGLDPARARLLIGRDTVSDNPKLDNMRKGLADLTTDLILAIDGNVVVTPDLWDQLNAVWGDGIGAVSSPSVGSDPRSFGADIECAFLNTLFARFLLASDTLGGGFVVGKVIMLPRELLDAAGGPDALATEIAEDSAATKLVRRAGRKTRLIDRPVDQPLGVRSIGQVWSRMSRWARLRRAAFPAVYAWEWAMTPWLPVALGAVVAPSYGLSPAGGAGAVLAYWYGVEFALATIAGWCWRLPAAVVRDLMLIAIWPLPFVSSRYRWAGHDITTTQGRRP
jgi:ceramide glucosyltransferase